MLRNKEGFWWSKFEPRLPMPAAQPRAWKGKKSFLRSLGRVEMTVEYSQYRGSSKCRICDMLNGSKTFHTDEWEWPSGLRHYIEAHNVEPTPEFRDFIESFAKDLDNPNRPA